MVLGITNSYSLLHCPAEAQRVWKCNGVRNLEQLLQDNGKKTAVDDVKMIICECERMAVSAVSMQYCSECEQMAVSAVSIQYFT